MLQTAHCPLSVSYPPCIMYIAVYVIIHAVKTNMGLIGLVNIMKWINKYLVYFPVWLRNRLISAGLEPVINQTENPYVTSYERQFSTNIKIIIIILFTILLAWPLGVIKTGFNLIIFLFYIYGNLSIIRCSK